MKNLINILAILTVLLISFLFAGCQNNNYHAVEYFEDGSIKKEVNGTTSGVPNWSTGKDFNAIKVGG